MTTPSTIDPSQAVPQAPRALRIGSRGFARRQKAAMAGQPAPAAEDDDDEDEEDDDEDPDSSERDGAAALAAKDAALESSLAACATYSAALEACRGNDGANAHMAAEEAGDDLTGAHGAFKSSSMAMRGAAADVQPPAPAPAPPTNTGARVDAGAVARAVATLAGPSADAQLEVTRDAALGKKLRALFGGTHEEAEGLARAAIADAADAKGLREKAAIAAKAKVKRDRDDAEKALSSKLAAAVRAQKFARAELFDVAAGAPDASGRATEILTPQAWTREMPVAALDAMIARKQARAQGGASGGPLVPENVSPISADVRAYGEARGYTEAQMAKLQAMTTETKIHQNTGAGAPTHEAP